MATDSLILCQLSQGLETDWIRLYESAFPADERMSTDEIRILISHGRLFLHRTLNKEGDLLCFSLVYPISDFVLLSYIATDASKRSGGVGSKHVMRLMEILKTNYPNHLGMFLEIESTRESGLDAATSKARQRRLSFYQRLGAKRMCKDGYLLPSQSPGQSPRQGELLWYEFGRQVVSHRILPRIVREIYEKAYFLAANDPLIKKVLDRLDEQANPDEPGGCDNSPDKGDGSGGS